MGLLKLSGSLSAGPASASEAGVFPGMSLSAAISTLQATKSFNAATGILPARINSSGAFVALNGVGATGPVLKAFTLYLKSDTAIDLELTHDDGLGGSTVVVIPVHGLHIQEFPSTKYLKSLRAKGVAQLEYFAAGDAVA